MNETTEMTALLEKLERIQVKYGMMEDEHGI